MARHQQRLRHERRRVAVAAARDGAAIEGVAAVRQARCRQPGDGPRWRIGAGGVQRQDRQGAVVCARTRRRIEGTSGGSDQIGPGEIVRVLASRHRGQGHFGRQAGGDRLGSMFSKELQRAGSAGRPRRDSPALTMATTASAVAPMSLPGAKPFEKPPSACCWVRNQASAASTPPDEAAGAGAKDNRARRNETRIKA
jgi:hypothetical protein